jgi:NitT/TauT family transport system substrate-binding protein
MAVRLYENFRGFLYAPFYAAGAIGAYAAEGVEVELVASPDPLASAAALRSGAADAMWGGPLRVLIGYDREPDCDLVCLTEVVARDPFLLVGRAPRPNFRMADLSSLRFASVSEVPTPWICLADDIRRAGLDPATLPRIADRSMADNAAALQRGELDVIQVFEPIAETLLRAGCHIWYAAADRGLTAYTCFVTRKPTLASRRDEFAAMARAVRRTLAWVHATPDADVARTVAPFFPDTSPAVLAGAVGRYKQLGVWGRDGVLRPEGFDRLKAAMLAAGMIRTGADYASCVDATLGG